MRVSSIKLGADGRARHAGEALGLCLLPLAAGSAAYPVTVRTRDGEEFEVQGPHAYDFGRASSFDIHGAPFAEFSLVTYTRPGEAFSAGFAPVTAAAIGAAVAAPTAGAIAAAVAASLTPAWVSLGAKLLSDIVASGDLGAGTYYLAFDGADWVFQTSLASAIKTAVDVPEVQAWRVSLLAPGAGHTGGTITASIVSGWSPETLTAIAAVVAGGAGGCASVDRMATRAAERGLIVKVVVSATASNLDRLVVSVDGWRIPVP